MAVDVSIVIIVLGVVLVLFVYTMLNRRLARIEEGVDRLYEMVSVLLDRKNDGSKEKPEARQNADSKSACDGGNRSTDMNKSGKQINVERVDERSQSSIIGDPMEMGKSDGGLAKSDQRKGDVDEKSDETIFSDSDGGSATRYKIKVIDAPTCDDPLITANSISGVTANASSEIDSDTVVVDDSLQLDLMPKVGTEDGPKDNRVMK